MLRSANRFVFTINNYSPEEQYNLRNAAEHDDIKYLVFGREVGDSGTPHLQGFIIFTRTYSPGAARRFIGARAHIENARGTSDQAATYCKKEGDFEEFGQVPRSSGGKSQAEAFKAWVLEQETKPTVQDAAVEHFGFVASRGIDRTREFINLLRPDTLDVAGEYRPCQRNLATLLDQPPDDRKIVFIVDTRGGTGKSWFIKKWYSEHSDTTQILSVGKRDDIAYAIDPTKSVFLFDLPRSSSEYLQYTILEQLKDRIVFSPKYQSGTKILNKVPHVVVFMNEQPDRNKLSQDRYKVVHWINIP